MKYSIVTKYGFIKKNDTFYKNESICYFSKSLKNRLKKKYIYIFISKKIRGTRKKKGVLT